VNRRKASAAAVIVGWAATTIVVRRSLGLSSQAAWLGGRGWGCSSVFWRQCLLPERRLAS